MRRFLFDAPFGVFVDVSDNILVCDSYNHRVQIFDKNGKWVHTFGKQGSDEGYLNLFCMIYDLLFSRI